MGTSQTAVSMIHRIVQADGRRFSLKLEQAYWTLLEEEAQRKGVSTGRLVQEVAREASGEASLTATLRLYCLEMLRDRLAGGLASAASAEGEGASQGPVLSALQRVLGFFCSLPAAGLLLNRQEQVICVNRAFEDWSRVRGDHLVGKPVHWHFQLRMSEPVATVLERFAQGAPQSLAARVSYISPGRIVVANARVSLVWWNHSEDFVWSVVIDAPRAQQSPHGKPDRAAELTPG